MTPTLLGRWQTRILLFATVGLLVCLPFFFLNDRNPIFFVILAYLAGFGLGWDVLYNYFQQHRWDHDWPAALQLLAGIWEAIFFVALFKLVPLPGVAQDMPIALFALHYSLVWLSIFVVSQSLMRIIFPRWRFKGGEWL
ncbi:MAG: hypothetical protein Kow00121_33210 [Elainellaceae cyanobacterium]